MRISFYKDQIKKAEDKLSSLPDYVHDWQAQRRIEAERRALIRDIDYYQMLLELAEDEKGLRI